MVNARGPSGAIGAMIKKKKKNIDSMLEMGNKQHSCVLKLNVLLTHPSNPDLLHTCA